MISKLTAIIMAIVSFISGLGGAIPTKAEVYYNVSYGEHTRQIMDIAFPSEYEETQGVVLFLHGGGWMKGSKATFTKKAISVSKKLNCIAVSMNYRYISKDINCSHILDDIDTALKKVKSMAKSRGIDANKVMLVGHSAGAHLALIYSYTRKNTAPIKPAAVVSYSAPMDLTSDNFVNHNSLGSGAKMRGMLSLLIGETLTEENFISKKDSLLKYSPINHVTGECVPTIVVQGGKDTVVFSSDTQEFVKKLKENGVVHMYYELPNSGHSLKNDKEIFDKSMVTFVDYVNKYVK